MTSKKNKAIYEKIKSLETQVDEYYGRYNSYLAQSKELQKESFECKDEEAKKDLEFKSIELLNLAFKYRRLAKSTHMELENTRLLLRER